MPADLTLSLGTLYAFLLVLARVGGALTFVPLPGINAVPEPVRVALAFGFTLSLYARWPVVNAATVSIGTLVGWAAAEAALGIAIGVCVAIVLEASTIDPNTQADSGILLVLSQLMAGMMFFALGLDREILRLFARSLDKVPVGTYIFGPSSAEALIRLGSSLFSTGVRLALPVVALLVMVDVALALLGRLNSQLQLLSLAFPAKMLTALLVLSWVASLFPRVMTEIAGHAFTTAYRILGI